MKSLSKRHRLWKVRLRGRQEAGEGSAVWVWGRGREGQLGGGSSAGAALPRAVDALRCRRVLQASCHSPLDPKKPYPMHPEVSLVLRCTTARR